MVRFINIIFVLSLILSLLFMNTLVSAEDFCADDINNPSSAFVCCEELCYADSTCQLVVACFSSADDPQFVSKVYANVNSMVIKEYCYESPYNPIPGNEVCSSDYALGVCNGVTLGEYECAPDCVSENGNVEELYDCNCGTEFVPAGDYCCYDIEDGYQTSSESFGDECRTELQNEVFSVSGILRMNGALMLPVENFVPVGIAYSDYEIGADGVFSINEVPANTYSLGFTNADLVGELCVLCEAPAQTIDVSLYPASSLDFTATCQVDSTGLGCENLSPPIIPDENCELGECNAALHAICELDDENGGLGFVLYDLTNQDDYDAYCYTPGNCLYSDPICANFECEPNGCEGTVPTNCFTPEQDPDVFPGGCNIGSNQWCNTTLAPLNNNDGWMTWGENGFTNEYYCSVCPNDADSCESSECGDGEITGIETCDYGDPAYPSSDAWGNQYNEGALECGGAENCNYPGEENECRCRAPEAICNNGILEPSEECEFVDDQTYDCPNQGEVCNSFTCQCEQESDCTYTPEFAIQEIITLNKTCTNQALINVTVIQGCQDYIDGIQLYAFDGEDYIPVGGLVDVENNIAELTYNFTEPNTNYDVKIEIWFQGETEGQMYDQIISLQSGDYDCMNWFNTNDNYECTNNICTEEANIYSACSENNILTETICDDGEFCANLDEGAQCLPTSTPDKCTACSGISGMFGDYSDRPFDDIDCFGLFEFSLVEDEDDGPFACYKDVLYSNVDKPNACANVDSCYNYHSVDVCEDDPCKKELDGLGCEWAPYNLQTGKGVCKPKTEQFIDCNNALDFKSNNLFLYNELFNPEFYASSSRVCGLYGDCYYRFTSDIGSSFLGASCINQDELICNDFLNIDDCIGEDNEYDFNIDDSTLIGNNYSNNLISSESKCKWDVDDVECIRDADDNNYDDSSSSEPRFNFLDNINVQTDNIPAQRDFISPVSELIEDEFLNGNLFGLNPVIPYFITDDYYSADGLNFYYCVDYLDNQISRECNLPTKEDNWDKVESYPLILNLEEAGEYKLYYFAMDDSLNIEPIKTFDFLVDATIPNILIDYSYETFPFIPDYKSDLTIDFSVETYSSDGAHCQAYLYSTTDSSLIDIAGVDESEENSHLMDAIGINFHLEYYGLVDGLYSFEVTCSDMELGNTLSLSEEIDIQGDTRIFNATPHFAVLKNENVEISIKTHNNATCYYLLRDSIGVSNDYETIIDCLVDDGDFDDVNLDDELICGEFGESTMAGSNHLHSTNLDFSYPNNISGVYVYDVGCEIEAMVDGDKVYEGVAGNDADLIIFSQDYSPPIINFSINDNGQGYFPFNSHNWYYQPRIRMECIDNSYYPGGTFTVFGQNLIFGCPNNLYYQDLGISNVSCSFPLQSRGNPLELNMSDPDIGSTQNHGGNKLRICYSGLDNHSNPNIAPILNPSIQVDAVKPNITSFNIYKQHAYDETILELHKAFYDVVIEPDEDVSSVEVSFVIIDSSTSPIILPSIYDNETGQIIATINMFRYPQLLDQELDLSFSVSLIDEHGLGNEYNNYYTIHVNTLAPPAPIIEPIFSDYHKTIGAFTDLLGNVYPGIYHEINAFQGNTTYWNESIFNLQDTFYLSQEEVFLTGFTGEAPLLLSLLIYDQIAHEFFDLEVNDIYDQEDISGINEVINLVETVTTHSLIVNLNGSTKVYLNTEYEDNWADSMIGTYAKVPIPEEQFVSFKSHGKRTTYENYFKYYKVIDVFTNDTIHLTYLVLDVPLESALDRNAQLKLFDKTKENVPYDYYALQLNKPYEFVCGLDYGTNAYSFRIRGMFDTLMINDTEDINLFIDNVAPVLRKSDSTIEGVHNEENQILKFNITEHACGSGLNIEGATIQLFIVNDILNDDLDEDLDEILYDEFFLTEDNLLSIGEVNKVNLVHYEFEYLIEDPISSGKYNIKINIKDYAGNELNPSYNWMVDINTHAPTKPVVDVINSNREYNPWDKKYFVSESPVINLIFEEDINLNSVGLANSLGLGSFIELICTEVGGSSAFSCSLPVISILDDGIYQLSIDVSYREQIYIWNDTKIVVDTTAPTIVDTVLPKAMRSDALRSFKINLENAEQDILINLTSEGLSHLEEDMSAGPDRKGYAAYINANNFRWVSGPDPYSLTVTIFDRAMNSDSITDLIFVDDDPPVINITRFESGGVILIDGGDPLNITTKNTTLLIEGSVNDSLIKSVCVSATTNLATIEIDEPCQFLCEDGEIPPGCIEESTGNFQFIFELVFPSFYETGTEIWNYINLVATDEAYNVGYETLSALMDWQAPELIGEEI